MVNPWVVVTAARVGLRNEFPPLDQVLQMSALSLLMYRFVNEKDDETVCRNLNLESGSSPRPSVSSNNNDSLYFPANFSLPGDLKCHWYYHDRTFEGTQLLIVSSVEYEYLAIAFAGTDDFKTALLDVDIFTRSFGDDNGTFSLPAADENVKVHEGFNNAIFKQGLFREIVSRFEKARKDLLEQNPGFPLKLYTTGHSLGAANAILAAVGLTIYYQQDQPRKNETVGALRNNNKKKTRDPQQQPTVTTLNFGCPCSGNRYWRDYLHSSPTILKHIGIWRFVLGWDLVPRLPKLFYHVGHTVQLSRNQKLFGQDSTNVVKTQPLSPTNSDSSSVDMWTRLSRGLFLGKEEDTAMDDYDDDNYNDDDDDNYYDTLQSEGNPSWSTDSKDAPFQGTALAYYQHYGDQLRGYASVPMGWSEEPFIWVPGAIASHHAAKYWQFFFDYSKAMLGTSNNVTVQWINEFVPFSSPNNNTDDRPPNVDDDFYVEPPDGDQITR